MTDAAKPWQACEEWRAIEVALDRLCATVRAEGIAVGAHHWDISEAAKAERARAEAAEAQADRLAAALRWDWDGFESWAHADESQVYHGNEPDRAWYQHAYWKLKEKGLKAIAAARAALADVPAERLMEDA